MFMNGIAAVSCSTSGYRLGGVKMGLGLTGKPGRAWVGVWVGHGILAWCMGGAWHGWLDGWWWCMAWCMDGWCVDDVGDVGGSGFKSNHGTIKSPVSKCFQYPNVQNSDTHCISFLSKVETISLPWIHHHIFVFKTWQSKSFNNFFHSRLLRRKKLSQNLKYFKSNIWNFLIWFQRCRSQLLGVRQFSVLRSSQSEGFHIGNEHTLWKLNPFR